MRPLALSLILLASCTSSHRPAWLDVDASADAHVVPLDAGTDAGPPCACTSGPCCDGCNPLPVNTVCSDVYASSYCQNIGNTPLTVITVTDRTLCDGVTPGCNAVPVHAYTPTTCVQSDGYICRIINGRAVCR